MQANNRTPYRTLGELARYYDRPEWMFRKLLDRGLLPPASRIGIYRVIHIDDMPQVEAAMRAAGYLGPTAAEETAVEAEAALEAEAVAV